MNLDGILTARVKTLLNETKNLNPDMAISIEEMTDQNDLKVSDGALIKGDSSGKATIFLDPYRADEYRLAHEIIHLKLFRSGWPKFYPMIHDQLTIQLTLKMSNLIEHYLIYPEIKDIGIDIEVYKENFISHFAEWTVTESNGLQVLDNASTICEGLLFGEPYITKIIETMEKIYPKSLKLAFKFENVITSSKLNKKDIRKTSVSLLDFFNDWLRKETQEIIDLRQTIGIRPLFTESELNKKATKLVYFKTKERINIDHENHYLAFFFLMTDGTRFITFLSNNDEEPPFIRDIRKVWKTKNLRYLLDSLDYSYGVYEF